jgi:serine/threonine-protein kinase
MDMAVRVPDGAVLRQLDRIVNSATLRSAGRLRAFLRFVVEEALAGRQDQIKEYTIGRAVCGRTASFDPKADPIVRVDASRLRSRLETYYETEGLDDEIRIELSKGSYVPTFRSVAQTHGRAEPRYTSLAVLPFVNLSPVPDRDYLADSLTEELIHSLARLERLRVIARSSVFQFKGSSESGQRIGKRLHVKYVLEGSVRAAGDRLRITAQLIEVTRGWLVWSEKYECAWGDVFGVQDEIAASITDALEIQLTGEIAPDIFVHVTDDGEAFAAYLRGRHYWNQRTPEALAASLRCYEQALERDPGCAPAYAGIADTLVVMALNDQESTLAVMPRARAAAHKALELRPGWPEALASLGFVKSVFDWDWEGGACDLQESIRRRPGSPTAHYLYGIVNSAPCGRWSEAIGSMHAALRLDPVSPVLLRDLGVIHFMRRAWEEAEAAWRQAEELSPAFRGCLFWRARLAIETGRFDDAIDALQSRLAAGPANTRVPATMAYAWARCGARDQAEGILRDLQIRATHGRVPPLDFAIVWLGLESWEQAMDWLEKACEERAATLYQFGVDPIYDPIRAHPRAEALRLAIGLPPVTLR